MVGFYLVGWVSKVATRGGRQRHGELSAEKMKVSQAGKWHTGDRDGGKGYKQRSVEKLDSQAGNDTQGIGGAEKAAEIAEQREKGRRETRAARMTDSHSRNATEVIGGDDNSAQRIDLNRSLERGREEGVRLDLRHNLLGGKGAARWKVGLDERQPNAEFSMNCAQIDT